MIEKYAIKSDITPFPPELRAAVDKEGRITVYVFFDFVECEFVHGSDDWPGITVDRYLFPPSDVVVFHRDMCEEILDAIPGNDSRIDFYTSDEPNDDGRRDFTTTNRVPDHRKALMNSEPLALLVSLDPGDDGLPDRQALVRLRRVVAQAHERFDARVEQWYWTE